MWKPSSTTEWDIQPLTPVRYIQDYESNQWIYDLRAELTPGEIWSDDDLAALEDVMERKRLPDGRPIAYLRVCFSDEVQAIEQGDALYPLGVMVCTADPETGEPVRVPSLRFPSSDLTARMDKHGLSMPMITAEWDASYSANLSFWKDADSETLDLAVQAFGLAFWMILTLIMMGL